MRLRDAFFLILSYMKLHFWSAGRMAAFLMCLSVTTCDLVAFFFCFFFNPVIDLAYPPHTTTTTTSHPLFKVTSLLCSHLSLSLKSPSDLLSKTTKGGDPCLTVRDISETEAERGGRGEMERGEEAGGMCEWTFSILQWWCTSGFLVQLNPQIHLVLCGIFLLVWVWDMSKSIKPEDSFGQTWNFISTHVAQRYVNMSLKASAQRLRVRNGKSGHHRTWMVSGEWTHLWEEFLWV